MTLLDWEQRKLVKVLTVSKERNKNLTYTKDKILSVSREAGVVNQIEYQGRSFAGKDISKYKVVHPGQVIYTKSPLKNAPYGIFQISEVNGLVSPLYAIYSSTSEVKASFVGLILKNDNIATKYLAPLVSKGAKNTINITDEGALEGKITYPSKSEQLKIINLLKKVSHIIELQQRKLKQLQLIRKGLLQQILKKNSNWKLTKLKSILNIRNEQIYPNINYPLMSFVQKKGIIPKNERYNRKFLVKGVKKYKVTKLGDFIYSSNNLDTGSIGVNKTRNAVISPVYSIFSSKSYRESQFVGLLSEDKYFIYKMLRYRQGVVYGQWKIPEKDFLNLEIKIPDQKTQENIINLFYKVDKIIEKEENLTTELSKLKKFLLQNMFM